MILEHIQQRGSIPQGSKPEHVAQLMGVLVCRLTDNINRPMYWYAVAYVAVEAGYVKARKRKTQRVKLLKQINVCMEFLGHERIVPDDDWEETNLHYGYGICASPIDGRDPMVVAMLARMLCDSLKHCRITQSESMEFQMGHDNRIAQYIGRLGW